MEQNIWIQDGNTFVKGSATAKAHPEGLPKGIYEVKESMTDYYLMLEHYELVDFEILDGCYFFARCGLFDEYIETFHIVDDEFYK